MKQNLKAILNNLKHLVDIRGEKISKSYFKSTVE